MSIPHLSYFEWATDPARTADEKYFIWLLWQTARFVEHAILSVVEPERQFDFIPAQYYAQLYLNPSLIPETPSEGLALTESLTLEIKVFPGAIIPLFGDFRRIREAGALRFFPALEEVRFGDSRVRDLSFLTALPNLRKLSLASGDLIDLEPLRTCTQLRSLELSLVVNWVPRSAPPLYWLDASPLGALTALETLTYAPNAAVLSGLTFPNLRIAVLSTTQTIQRDCHFLPNMPSLLQLTLDGVQSLCGLSKFPQLSLLTISGPLRDWGDVAQLPSLECLDISTTDGWPQDIHPLTAAPALRWIGFHGDIPRNYWPLTGAPHLCELEVTDVPSLAMDLQAINLALTSWDSVFLHAPPRTFPPLQFYAADVNGLPYFSQADCRDKARNPILFLKKLCWMKNRTREILKAGLADDYDYGINYGPPAIYQPYLALSITIRSQAVALRLPNVIDLLRRAMAGSSDPWEFNIHIELQVPDHHWTPQQRKWIAQIEAEHSNYDYDAEDKKHYQSLARKRQHLIENDYRVRTAEEEGDTLSPEDLAPPPDLLPPSPPTLVPTTGSDDTSETDFELKPYDQQEANDSNDNDDDDSDIATEINDDAPDWFRWDPNRHPLADSYRLFGILHFDGFYFFEHFTAIAENLMGRKIDGSLPKRS